MRIRSVACSMPSRIVSNEDTIEEMRAASEPYLSPGDMRDVTARIRSLFRLAGAKYRHVRDDSEPARDFAVKAAREALDRAVRGSGPRLDRAGDVAVLCPLAWADKRYLL